MKTLAYHQIFTFILCCMICSSAFSQSAEYVPGQVLIKMKSEKSIAQKANLKNQMSATARKAFPKLDIELWEVENVDVLSLVEQYKNHPDIAFIEPNYIYSVGTTTPNDPALSNQWGLNNTGQNNGTEDVDIDAPEAWDIATGSPSVVVAIIDTGIDWKHEDLVDNIWQNLGEDADGDGRVLEFINGAWVFDPGDENGIDDDNNGYPDDFVGWDFRNEDNDPFDGHFHGTHVAGTVGAKGDNNIGVSGVTWDVQLAALKFLSDNGSGSTSDAVEAVNYVVAMGIPVSNNSWSGGSFSDALYTAIDEAKDAGHLFVAAAGNNARDTDAQPRYPSAYDHANIISVASTDRNDSRSSFSNYGVVTVDLGAPGSSIFNCFPNNSYNSISGTSMAAPHVAGTCALLWEQFPNRTYAEIKDAILNSVDPNADLNGRCVSNGRLNLFSAMTYFAPAPPPTCRQEDSLSLVALYNATNGANWTIPWNLNQPMTDWEGVTLTGDGCLKVLNLPSNGLNGTLPSDIGDLQDATFIDLGDNQLNGPIPGSLGNLSNSGALYLDNNQLSGDIPPSISNLQGLAFLLLNDNNLTGSIPAEFANMGDLGFLTLNNNNLSGCYEDELDVLCTQLLNSGNASISDGNNFNTDWDSYCNNGSGVCTSDVLPGDANADGEVTHDDVLYWGYAKDFTGPVRPNATDDCLLQPSPDWTNFVGDPLVNAKHQDCDGNGLVDNADANIIAVGIVDGCSVGSDISAYIESTLNFDIELVGVDANGANIYDIFVRDMNGNPITAHGVSFIITFGNIDYQTATIDTNNSSLGTHESFYGSVADGIWVALTRTDGNDSLLDGPVLKLIGVIEDLIGGSDDDMFSIDFSDGHVMQNSNISTVTNKTVYDVIEEENAPVGTNLVLTASVNHAQCNTLGSAVVEPAGGIAPYSIQWNTGATTAEITDLTPGSYIATVVDVNGLEETIEVEVEGLLAPPHDSNGDLIPCSVIDPCPTLLTPTDIVDGVHQAATAVNSDGIIINGSSASFKAGETIILNHGFEVKPNAGFSAEIEDCPQN